MPEPEYEPSAAAPSFHFVNTPWWRWNLVTLAVVLFVFLWVREVAVLSNAITWLSAAMIIGVWAAYPVAKEVRVTSLAKELARSAPRLKPTNVARRRAAACRAAAVLCFGAFIVQLVATWMTLEWSARVNGSLFANWGLFAFVLLRPVAACVVSVGAAIGLWTIADMCVAIDRMQPSDTNDQNSKKRARQPY